MSGVSGEPGGAPSRVGTSMKPVQLVSETPAATTWGAKRTRET